MADNQPLEQLTSRVPGPLSVVISKLRFVSFFFPPLKTYAVRHLQTTVTEPLSQQKLLMQALQVLKGHKLDPCFQITATHSGVQNCGSTCLEGIWNQAARTVESHPAMSQQYVVLRKRMVGFGLSLMGFVDSACLACRSCSSHWKTGSNFTYLLVIFRELAGFTVSSESPVRREDGACIMQ